MEAHTAAAPGLVDTFRRLASGLLGSVHDRLELLAVECHEEKLRLVQIFIWISAGLFTAMLAITFASLTLVYLFWDSARLAVLVGLTAFHTVALGGIAVMFRRYLARLPRPFSATLSELREDRACIRAES